MNRQIDWQKRIEKIKAQKEKLKERIKFRNKQLKLKQKIVPMHKLHKELWTITSKTVRLSSNHCYTCNKPLEYKDRNAGHYWAQGSHGAARYELDNLRVQCVTCNSFKSGNIAEYGLRLRQEIGDERFDKLALLVHSTRKYSRDELEQMINSRKAALEIIEQNL